MGLLNVVHQLIMLTTRKSSCIIFPTHCNETASKWFKSFCEKVSNSKSFLLKSNCRSVNLWLKLKLSLKRITYNIIKILTDLPLADLSFTVFNCYELLFEVFLPSWLNSLEKEAFKRNLLQEIECCAYLKWFKQIYLLYWGKLNGIHLKTTAQSNVLSVLTCISVAFLNLAVSFYFGIGCDDKLKEFDLAIVTFKENNCIACILSNEGINIF